MRGLLFLLLAAGCASSLPARTLTSPPPARPATDLEATPPEAQGMSRAPMVRLTRWIRDTPIPLFSLLISRHGKLVYELYTSSFERDDAHN
jgi:hypothetical protein